MTRHHIPTPSGLTEPFLGTHAIRTGLVTPRQLRSPAFTKLFHNVYVPAQLPVTHELRCRAVALIAPPTATLTGVSAAATYGYHFAQPFEPVEFLVTDTRRFTAKRGVRIRRSTLGPPEGLPWQGIRLATPLRATLDVLRETEFPRTLPRVVSWLDVLLRDGFVDHWELSRYLRSRRDQGVVRARKALSLANPRSESLPESEIRVWLRLGGLSPEPEIGFLGFRIPLCFPNRRLAIEYDGPRDGDPARANGDAWRRQRLRAEGWEFVIVTPEGLRDDPEGMVETVRQALHRRTVPVAA
jgi:very-short-patch-repair endonuclease